MQYKRDYEKISSDLIIIIPEQVSMQVDGIVMKRRRVRAQEGSAGHCQRERVLPPASPELPQTATTGNGSSVGGSCCDER